MPTLSRQTALWVSIAAAVGCILFASGFLVFAVWGLHAAFGYTAVHQDDTRLLAGLVAASLITVGAPLAVIRLSLILLVVSWLELAIDRCFVGGHYARAASHARHAAAWAWGGQERQDFDRLARQLEELDAWSGKRKDQPPFIY